MSSTATAILLSVLLAGVGLQQVAEADGTLAASCTVTWSLPSMTCATVSTKIVDQMKSWSGGECPSSCSTCCYYSITTDTSEAITGTHKVYIGSYALTQDLTFTLATPSGSEGCTVTAYSVQESFYVVKDSGQDYCNLKNIMSGSGLTRVSGVVENVAGSSCTDLAEASC